MKTSGVLLLLIPALAVAADLPPLKKTELATVLALQREISTSNPSESSYFVRVFEAPVEIGECGGSIASCPDVRLLISASTGDLLDTPVLYELPRAKGWQFVRWLPPDDARATGLVVRTELPEANIDPDERGKWHSTECSVWITTEKARMECK